MIYEVNFILSDPFHWSYWIFVANFTRIFKSQNLVPACQNAVAETPNVILPEEQTTGIPRWIIVNPVFPPFPRCKISSNWGIPTKLMFTSEARPTQKLQKDVWHSQGLVGQNLKQMSQAFGNESFDIKFWYIIPTGQTLQTKATAWVGSFEDTNVEFGGETTALHKLLRAFAAKCSTMARNDGILMTYGSYWRPMVSIKCMNFERLKAPHVTSCFST